MRAPAAPARTCCAAVREPPQHGDSGEGASGGAQRGASLEYWCAPTPLKPGVRLLLSSLSRRRADWPPRDRGALGRPATAYLECSIDADSVPLNPIEMESEADRTAAPATPVVAAETSDDAIQEESLATTRSSDGKPGSGAAAATSVPEVEVQLFRHRRPVAVFRSQLCGCTLDQLEVGNILEQHGLKFVFAFDPAARKRGVAFRFNPRNGRALLTYAPGSTIFLDGEPKDSLLKPITKMVIGVAVVTVVAAVLLKEAKMLEWLQSSKLGTMNFAPWVLACMIIVFMRLRKRTKDVMKKFGWVS